MLVRLHVARDREREREREKRGGGERRAEHPRGPTARYARHGATIPAFPPSLFLGFPSLLLLPSCPIHLRPSAFLPFSALAAPLFSVSLRSFPPREPLFSAFSAMPLELAAIGVMLLCILRVRITAQ